MFVLNALRRRRRRQTQEHETNNRTGTIEKPSVRIVSRVSIVAAVNRRRDNFNNDKNAPLGMTEVDRSMPLLYSLARSWAWEAVDFRCHTHPDEASAAHRDYLGDTCLHWAVFGRPPIRTVRWARSFGPPA